MPLAGPDARRPQVDRVFAKPFGAPGTVLEELRGELGNFLDVLLPAERLHSLQPLRGQRIAAFDLVIDPKGLPGVSPFHGILPDHPLHRLRERVKRSSLAP